MSRIIAVFFVAVSLQLSSSPAFAGTLPKGVVSADPGVYVVKGDPCCWLAKDAKFVVNAPARAKALKLHLYTPTDIPALKTREQTIAVTVDGGPTTFHHVALGDAFVSIPLKSANAAMLHVSLDMSSTFQPSAESHGSDSRVLSLYLRSALAQ